MTHNPTLPDDSAIWRVLRWEPMVGSGERLSVSVIVHASDGIKSFPLLRVGVLHCLYGEQGGGAAEMIRAATSMTLETAKAVGIERAVAAMEGFELDDPRTTRAENALVAAKHAALLYSSLAAGNPNIVEADEKPGEDDMVAARFAREVEREVLRKRIALSPYFHQSASPISGGHPIRYTFLSPHAVVQTSIFKTTQINYWSSSSRLRMWELMTVMKDSPRRGALIVKKPQLDSPDVSLRAAKKIQMWINQLTAEGDRQDIEVLDVETTEAAAEKLLSFAGTD